MYTQDSQPDWTADEIDALVRMRERYIAETAVRNAQPGKTRITVTLHDLNWLMGFALALGVLAGVAITVIWFAVVALAG